MQETHLPTVQQIETLISYLPRLYAEGFSPIERWDGGEKLKDGSFTLPYPKYNPLVEEFFRHVSGDGWLDYEYNPEQAYQMLKDENAVKTASLPQIQTMLTFCVRGERFSDGHWGEMIEKGYVRRLLERLNEIRSEQLRLGDKFWDYILFATPKDRTEASSFLIVVKYRPHAGVAKW